MSSQSMAAVIYVLGDDQSENTINPYLESQGHTVYHDSTYQAWDGTIPMDTDVVLYLYGYDYGDELGEDTDPVKANQSILNFVASGGGLIFTEWYAYEELDEPVSQLLPVKYNGDYYYEANWNVSSGYENHDLVRGLANSDFTEGDGSEDTYSDVSALVGTTVVMEDENGIPLLSYTHKHGGTVVHINDGMTYDDAISDNMLSVINSAATFAANNKAVAVNEPSTIILMFISLLALVRLRGNR
ncbi:hypothetical protein OE749_07685 [Aestuariibacter sp. AA17]|uniref:Uncharacterized protein n=1 Tax=Fluctibacter corallii TaxID=2984329 RepID=A0ABT3A8G0_9ALTE|nr:hypothetical protein [Aestuariibacter sp. AA17]